MMKCSFATFALTAALALGALALASVDASAQVAGRGNGGGPPPSKGDPGTVGGSGDDVLSVILGDQPDCNKTSIAAVRCRRPKPILPPLVKVDLRCVDVAHPHYVLANGQVVIDQRKSKIRFCDDMHTLQ